MRMVHKIISILIMCSKFVFASGTSPAIWIILIFAGTFALICIVRALWNAVSYRHVTEIQDWVLAFLRERIAVTSLALISSLALSALFDTLWRHTLWLFVNMTGMLDSYDITWFTINDAFLGNLDWFTIFLCKPFHQCSKVHGIVFFCRSEHCYC